MNPRRQDHPAALIAFPASVERRRPSPRGTTAEVIDLATYRRALDADKEDNAWARLVDLARTAWTWRDPESMDALEACVGQLKAAVREEWEAV